MYPVMRYWYCLVVILGCALTPGQKVVAEERGQEVAPSQTLGVRVSFQGDTVGNSIATVLEKAHEVLPQSIKPESYSISDTDSICGILNTRGYPPPCEAYLPLIDELNNAPVSKLPLKADMTIVLPGLKIEKNTSLRVFSKSDVISSGKGDELLRNWKYLDAKKIEKGDTFAVA